ncbi:MAG: GNAT family N-acetyltransferase [Nostocales cyanobacterium 94392]|nr:GNAT family N-acetyltransferase [Nostocales cyanobacterium 94392]
MKPEFEYSSDCHLEDALRFGNILGQCFLSTPEQEQSWVNLMGIENLRIIRQNQEIVGGLATIPMTQWWGGESVAMTGIAGVSITPEHRGTGAALSLMQHAIKELYDNGVSISVLYPATQRLYRKLGYEQGGSFCGWEIPAETIQIREQPLSVKAVPTDSQIFYELYTKQAKNINGYLNRGQPIWHRIMKPADQNIFYAYLIGSVEEPQGYIIFSQHSENDDAILRVRDWVVLTNAAATTFWSFLNNHRAQIDKIRWRGSLTDHLTLLLPEQTAKIKYTQYWMLRIINIEKALSARGYLSGIENELHLEITDDLIVENNGKFILSVSKGCGNVVKGGKGELKLDIRGLAPLYTGLFTAQQLQLAGKLDGTQAALSSATKIFAGSSPWMADFF